MLLAADIALQDGGGNVHRHVGHIVLDLVHGALLFQRDLRLGALHGLRRLVLRAAEDLLLAELGTAVGVAKQRLALGVGLLQARFIARAHLFGLGLGAVGVVVEVVDLLLARIDHVLDGLEEELFHDQIEDDQIAQREQAGPEIHTDKALKSRKKFQAAFLLSPADLVVLRRIRKRRAAAER